MNTVAIDEQVIERVAEAEKSEQKLVIVVGKPGSGKSKIMRELGQRPGWKYVDSKKLLTDELLEMPPKSRAGEAVKLMSDILAAGDAKVILLDNTQVLFAPVLQIDPVDVLKKVSRQQAIVAAWPGEYDGKNLIYLRNFGTEPVEYNCDGLELVVLP
ncbi:MAG: BREX-3 system P-loop-containing protein BrxF [Sporomusaceae bacterium]|jgi:hypothetical protein|nr:BREX-3 system P-loop-containing protein BrxF [Sporomusaceae bacterium]